MDEDLYKVTGSGVGGESQQITGDCESLGRSICYSYRYNHICSNSVGFFFNTVLIIFSEALFHKFCWQPFYITSAMGKK